MVPQKILIVDDDELIANSLSELLDHLGYQVCSAAKNYEMAVKLFTEFEPDLTILDINLEGELNGIDVANYINSHSNRPFIFHTGSMNPIEVQNAESTKPYALLRKPTTIEEIHFCINEALKDNNSLNQLKTG